MKPDDIRATVDKFQEATNGHDLDAVAQLLTDDCIFEDTTPPDGGRHVGRDAVLEAFRKLFAASPEAHFDHESEVLVAGTDRAVLQWRYSWSGGHVRGVDLMRLRDGQIAETLAYVKG
jgi:uncharacterized protein (TIGR02246 family)